MTCFLAPEHLPATPTTLPLARPLPSDADPARLEASGYPTWLAQEFRLGFSRSRTHLPRRLVVPVHDENGILVGYAAQQPAKGQRPRRLLLHGDIEGVVFNLHPVASQSWFEIPVKLVAHPFDALHLRRIGHETVVSLMGGGLRELQLRRLVHRLPDRRFQILCDATEPGRLLAEDVALRLGRYVPVQILEFLEDGRTVASLTPEEF